MKIGIDIDGVILDSEREFRVQSELYDIRELNKNSVINNKELKAQLRYSWNKEEMNRFINTKFIKVAKSSNFMPGAIEVINLLKKEGHELIVITARGGFVKEMRNIAEKQFEEKGLIFDKCYWTTEEKLEVCKKENVDIMIDDYYKTCKETSDNKIKTLYFRDCPCYELEENEYLREVHNWGEIYRYIHEIGGK